MESINIVTQTVCPTDRKAERTVYFDYLRVIAIFAVIIVHVAAQNWYSSDVNGIQWQVFNLYDSLGRWSVPIFVMISGALFLNREIPVKKLYSKYVFRLAVSFVVWAVIYEAFSDNVTLYDKASAIIHGKYHMWFILMIIGLYMCVPIIKPIVKTDSGTKYYLILSFIFAFLLPETLVVAKDFCGERMNTLVKLLADDVSQMNMHIVLGYSGYFVLGNFLNKTHLEKKQRIIIYILGLFGFAFTVAADLIVALKTQTPCKHFYESLSVNVLLEAVAVFTWFKYRDYKNIKLNGFVQKLGKYSFGVYLVHVLVIEQLNIRAGLNTLCFNPIFSVIVIGAIVFAVSFAISAILNHIPLIKKYIV